MPLPVEGPAHGGKATSRAERLDSSRLFALVLPLKLLAYARSCLSAMPLKDLIGELRSYNSPPHVVTSVMQGVLTLLALHATIGALASLPLQSFDMETQHELAFRMLQSGRNTGKVVVRMAATLATGCDGTHVVTGGTGGLGLLTGR